MKKLSVLFLTGALLVSSFAFTGCGSTTAESTDSTTTADAGTSTASEATTSETKTSEAATSDFDNSQEISVVSREDGSGTRGAFIELFGIEEKDASGNKIDHTTDEAIISNSTNVMMTTVSGDDYAIGYSSLGSLNDTVKAVSVDGVKPSAEGVKDGSYKISRPFNIVTKGDAKGVAKDFINFIMSADGQKVVEDNGYIAVKDGAAAFTSDNSEGKIVVAGSSSVTPVMEKLKEAYTAINAKAEIEVQESDSTTGITSATSGTCDIGMASRELKDEEKAGGVSSQAIALDGIAVIVNNNNPIENITSAAVKDIYTGTTTTWDAVK